MSRLSAAQEFLGLFCTMLIKKSNKTTQNTVLALDWIIYFILAAFSHISDNSDSFSSKTLLILEATDFRFIRQSEINTFAINKALLILMSYFLQKRILKEGLFFNIAQIVSAIHFTVYLKLKNIREGTKMFYAAESF